MTIITQVEHVVLWLAIIGGGIDVIRSIYLTITGNK
jgi:hypothetical protein